jgi:Zn-dependent protease
MSDDRGTTQTPNRGGPQIGVVRLGRIAGVEVRLHWTWGIAASLIALGLGSSVFPAAVPGLAPNTYYTMGVATALLFFVSLLLHELGHALQARREGIPTRGITLWMLGGIAESEAPFATAGTEARVALAGPAVTLVIGVGLVAVGQIGGLPQTVAAIVQWLGWTNLILLGFNLIPALPLDGGRVLRGALWRVYRNHMRATRDALRVSQVLAAAMIAFGLVWSLSGAGLNGLWLAFIGYFLMSSGRGERALAEMQARAAAGS